MIKILLTDDHELVREALCSVLEKETDFVVVGQAGTGEVALKLCRELQPDIVLMDIALPDMSGIEATRRLLAEHPSVRVLALSLYLDQSSVSRILEAGAIGYVNKAAGRDELLRGLRAAAMGTHYLSQNVASIMVQSSKSRDAEGVNTRLGKRESEVLLLIVDGKTSMQIAEQLHIATGTVEVHRRNIMRKLNLHNVAKLTMYAIRENLISP